LPGNIERREREAKKNPTGLVRRDTEDFEKKRK
jgi:hypothetical protein